MTAPPPGRAGRVPVLLAAGDAAWEPQALAALAAAPREVALVKRCLDLPDLLAAAATGTARAALVAATLPGLDADAVRRLARDGVAVVAVLDPALVAPDSSAEAERARLLRLGATQVVAPDDVAGVAAVLRAHAGDRPAVRPEDADALLAEAGGAPLPPPADEPGRVLAVWGPHGAPGRTTVALALAASAAARGRRTLLVDADPHGGTAGQHLAVLEEVSGLLSAARLANAGRLDRARLAGLAREVAPGWRLLTGLPRPDRWRDLREAALVEVVEVARSLDELVVVDAGSGLPATSYDGLDGPAREDLVRAVLGTADQVLVVAAADPVGLTRLARALRELLDQAGRDLPRHVVLNRVRSSLGWSEAELASLVRRVDPTLAVSFLPEDRTAADRALLAGRTVANGSGALRRAVAALHDELFRPAATQAARSRVRRVSR